MTVELGSNTNSKQPAVINLDSHPLQPQKPSATLRIPLTQLQITHCAAVRVAGQALPPAPHPAPPPLAPAHCACPALPAGPQTAPLTGSLWPHRARGGARCRICCPLTTHLSLRGGESRGERGARRMRKGKAAWGGRAEGVRGAEQGLCTEQGLCSLNLLLGVESRNSNWTPPDTCPPVPSDPCSPCDNAACTPAKRPVRDSLAEALPPRAAHALRTSLSM